MLRAVLLLLLAAPVAAIAQQPDTLRRGLLVSYNENLSFTAFHGGSLSLKLERAPTRAVRLGLNVELVGTQQEDELDFRDDATQTPPSFETGFTGTERVQTDNATVRLDLVLEVERYAAAAGRMRPYLLAGVFGGPRFTRLDDERQATSENEQRPVNQPPFTETQVIVAENTSRGTAWGGGLAGGLGVEWRVAGDFSLLAEYRTSLFFERSVNRSTLRQETTFSNSVNSNTSTFVTTDRSRFTRSTYGLRSLGLRVGAVLYF